MNETFKLQAVAIDQDFDVKNQGFTLQWTCYDITEDENSTNPCLYSNGEALEFDNT